MALPQNMNRRRPPNTQFRGRGKSWRDPGKLPPGAPPPRVNREQIWNWATGALSKPQAQQRSEAMHYALRHFTPQELYRYWLVAELYYDDMHRNEMELVDRMALKLARGVPGHVLRGCRDMFLDECLRLTCEGGDNCACDGGCVGRGLGDDLDDLTSIYDDYDLTPDPTTSTSSSTSSKTSSTSSSSTSSKTSSTSSKSGSNDWFGLAKTALQTAGKVADAINQGSGGATKDKNWLYGENVAPTTTKPATPATPPATSPTPGASTTTSSNNVVVPLVLGVIGVMLLTK